MTGGFECLNSFLTARWTNSTTPFHVNSGGTFVEAPSHCTLDDYDSQFFRTVLLSHFFLLICRQHKHSEREIMAVGKSSLKFLYLNHLCVSNKMLQSWLSWLYSDLVVSSVKGGGANWFSSFDLQMNTVIRFNHINITPSLQDWLVYPHPTCTQCKSLKSWMHLKHMERFSFSQKSLSLRS